VVGFTGFRPAGPSAKQELLRHLRGYRSAGVRYVLTPAGQPLPTSRTTFRLVFRSPTTRIYRLARTSPYFGAAGCRVTSSDRQSAWVSCRRQTTLIRRETWLPGWSAQLDGRPTAIHRKYRIFQTITVPPGSHHVTFSFTPPDMNWALLGLLGGSVLMCAPGLSRLLARVRSDGHGDGQAETLPA
jgi:hypothetical protein